jgi:hypothetical protein
MPLSNALANWHVRLAVCRSRYLRCISEGNDTVQLADPEAAAEDRNNEKYKAASKQVKRLQEACRGLEREIAARRNGSDLGGVIDLDSFS